MIFKKIMNAYKVKQYKKNLKNQFYIKYYMKKAGNNNPELDKDIDEILLKLVQILKRNPQGSTK